MAKKARKSKNDRTVKLKGEKMQAGQSPLGAAGRSRFGVKRRGRYEFEVLQGTEYSRNGRMALKVVLFDRVNDRYIEVVIEEESRKVLMYCNEPLSEHVGHGSDKPALRATRKS